MGRPGTAFFVAVLLSASASAEPGRPCPACRHETARAEGAAKGAADYLCGFCEVVLHVRPDGREAVSFRVDGQRREFDLVAGARILFPLPGQVPPEDVIVPVEEAALAAAPGAGHPVRLMGHPAPLPGHPVPLPAAPVGLPEHPVELPGHPVELPAHAVELPAHPVSLAGHPVGLPADPVELPAHPVVRPGHPVFLPGHPVWRPGHPMGLGGRVVTIARIAAPAEGERVVRHVVVPKGQSRFFGRPAMASVLR